MISFLQKAIKYTKIYIHEQDPGVINEISKANPRICQTDFAGRTAGTSVTRTLFQRYFPKKSRAPKISATVKKETSAIRPGDTSDRPLPSNVSVCENTAFREFATTPPSMFLLGSARKFVVVGPGNLDL